MATKTISTTYDHSEFEQLIEDSIAKAVKQLIAMIKPVAEPQKQILTRQETAKMLGISLTTLNSYTKRGVIKSCELGYKIRYRLEDINAALAEHGIRE